MASTATIEDRGDARHIAARLERLPYCSWHFKMRLIICTAWFFDAFDSVAIAYVLPVLIGEWHLNPQQIGSLISIGFAGQLVGALGFGWIAERWGRLNSMIITLLLFTLAALACAFARNYETLLGLRFIQGVGLGGEVPLMAAYVNEFAKATNRGRFSVSIQVLFSIALFFVALTGVWVVPHLGWQWLFVIGAVPALLALPLRFILPESPRWLASQGRFAEADAALGRIEAIAAREGKTPAPLPASLPAVAEVRPRIADLFRGIYLRRTIAVWFMWIGAYFVSYALNAWAPSLYRTVYHLPVETALQYGLFTSAIGLCASGLTIWLIEAWGRKPMLIMSFSGCCVFMLSFAFLPQLSAIGTLLVTTSGFFFLGFALLSLATYTAEIYPTHLRALGGGVASAWQRGASMVGTYLVGFILPNWGINAVFVVFGLFALMGAVVTIFFAIETRRQVLEQLSPA
jgi:putative MFS transporter